MISLSTGPETARQVWLTVAAIAEELGRKYMSRYLAGMWERDLAMDLQWKTPSWSWASAPGASEDYVHVWEDEGDDNGDGTKNSFSFRVVRCQVELAVPKFTHGAVTFGILVVTGRANSYISHPNHDDGAQKYLNYDGYLCESQEAELAQDVQLGEATIDALDPELHEGTAIVCFATRLIENGGGKRILKG
ncbi:hypothetical protein T440DRAFT_554057 [Plenodomus tracheiphilus IPT5]|uniref:Uncharacterized protein n=1 Tax=Plenodomus tracheiphilus IPT5 TaxID=1408161 RepID=A0A6A7BB67_9PLEO|nr:hypothetical protein T440DRAFT_554057 [Plenodomus tracheiphilus IPT5]